MTGPTGTVAIRAYERSARGETTRTFTRATSARDLDACGREGGEPPSGDGKAASAALAAASPSPVSETSPPPRLAAAAAPPADPVPTQAPTATAWPSLDESLSHPEALLSHWHGVLAGHRPHVPLDASRPQEGGAAVDFARYRNAMQARLQPILAGCASPAWAAITDNHPLRAHLEVVLDVSGALQDVGVAQSSGSASFDAAALEAVARASPYGPTPPSIRSAGDLVYLQWELSFDPGYGCTAATRPLVVRD